MGTTKKHQPESETRPASSASTGWLGVVATVDGRDRLLDPNGAWWCLPNKAKPGALVAMYRTGMRFGVANAGIFALFSFQRFDPAHDTNCMPYGSTLSHGALRYAVLSPLKQLSKPIQFRDLKADSVFRYAKCVRRSFQGTVFELTPEEVRRLLEMTREL
jgi:hypothetical protein